MKSIIPASTGLKSLDAIINNLQAGDNVVWQVDSIEDYRQFAIPFAKKAVEENKKFIYMRFAKHDPVIIDTENIIVHKLDAYSGFESFSKQVYNIITREGEDVYYVFDCLSDLLSVWATDLMIGNFFAITCPYLYELNTLAYFSLLRNSHSFKTIARIRETTQLLIDAYNFEGSSYVHPLKVLNRYSPTMFFPHLKKDNGFIPITKSEDATKFIHHIQNRGWEKTKRILDFWDKLFLKAEDLRNESADKSEKQKMVEYLGRIIIGRDERFLRLMSENFSLEDLINIKDRMIGTGYIGGKAAGMLMARSIINKDKEYNWNNILEPHDSFYIGSDVFYSYIVQNGWWKLLMEQKTSDGYFTAAGELHEKMLKGTFPEEITEQFQEMIEYMGQFPIIVRSSSLLEDSFGNSFAGKYESFFCVNQGSPKKRFMEFTEAVRKIYASTMNEDALAYRLQRGLDMLDEQMALLVQRVSGNYHENFFYPDVAGVGFSHNAYVWKNDLDPEAGMLRMVFGLGTRAVNRVEGDYPRIVALDQPLLKPLTDMNDMRRFSQHDADVLNITENKFQTTPVAGVAKENNTGLMDLIAIRDIESEEKMREIGSPDYSAWILTFDELLSNTSFVNDMHAMMKKLERHYNYPVDIEFTVNFTQDRKYRINLLQCRPHQTRGIETRVEIPSTIPDKNAFFVSMGNFLGGNISQLIKRIIYVNPGQYSSLDSSQKYDIARLVGKLNRQIDDREALPTLLLGPGRWGTTTPSLGVPVRFAEINNISVLVEIASMSENVLPELSFGTHFFQDLVETNIFYVAIFPEKDGVQFNINILDSYPNILEDIMPGGAGYKNVVKVCDTSSKPLKIMADIVSQKLVCFMQN